MISGNRGVWLAALPLALAFAACSGNKGLSGRPDSGASVSGIVAPAIRQAVGLEPKRWNAADIHRHDIARMQVEYGAIGVGCATVWEAVVMARAGLSGPADGSTIVTSPSCSRRCLGRSPSG